MAIAIDGNSGIYKPGSVASGTMTLSTTQSNCAIIVFQTGQENSLPSGFTCSGSTLGAFTKIASWAGAGGTDSFDQIAMWAAWASSPLTSEIITITQANPYDMRGIAFGISGLNQTSLVWDAGSPQHADGGVAATLTTVSPKTIVFGLANSGFDQGGPAAGFTQIPGLDTAQNFLVQYKILTATATNVFSNGYGEDWRMSTALAGALVEGAGGGGGPGPLPQNDTASSMRLTPRRRGGAFVMPQSIVGVIPAPAPSVPSLVQNQPPQPLARISNRRSAALAGGDVGNQFRQIGFLPFAPVQNYQPQSPITTNTALNNRRFAAVATGYNPGNQAVQVGFLPFGWPIQSVQPPNPATTNISLNNRRAAALVGSVENIEGVYSVTPPGALAPWWEAPSLPPPRPRWMRAAALEGGIEWGGEQFVIVWRNAGWEIQPPQPPAAAKRNRQPVTYEGSDGIEAPFTPPVVVVKQWGIDQASFAYRRPVRFDPTVAENLEGPLGRFQPFGWPVQPVQPPHPAPERRFGAMAPLSNIEVVFVPPVAVPLLFWETNYPQPPHRRVDRAGAIMPLENIEGTYTFVPPTPTVWETNWPQPPSRRAPRFASQPFNIERFTAPPPPAPNQWEANWPQPPHRRPERAAAALPVIGLVETPLTRFIPFWRMAPPHPEPHPRREKAGSIQPPLAITESRLRIFYPTFWHVLPPEPHPRPERGAALLPAGVLPIIKFRAVILNPNYIGVGQPRVMVSLGLPRNRTVLGVTNQVSQTNQLVPPIDSTVEIETVTFDFGLILVEGVTITGISAVTCQVVSGTDSDPASRLIGSASLITSPNSGGANQAVAQLVGTMLGGVTYRLQCVVTSSDGQTISLWNHLSCQTPN